MSSSLIVLLWISSNPLYSSSSIWSSPPTFLSPLLLPDLPAYEWSPYVWASPLVEEWPRPDSLWFLTEGCFLVSLTLLNLDLMSYLNIYFLLVVFLSLLASSLSFCDWSGLLNWDFSCVTPYLCLLWLVFDYDDMLLCWLSLAFLILCILLFAAIIWLAFSWSGNFDLLFLV